MIISMIAAMAENRVIGSQGKLPWKIPADLARFKAITTGHVVVMGRKTFESIGHPLPGRTNIILSRTRSNIEGCLVVRSLEEAIAQADGEEELFVIGGANVFVEAFPLAHRIYLTLVHQPFEGDVFFPEIPNAFVEIDRKAVPDTSPPCSFVTLEKVEQVEPGADAKELCNKGHVALNRELYYLARSCFEKAAELEDTPETSSFLAMSIVLSGGDIAAALKIAGNAVEREPQNPILYLNLGRLQIFAGLREAAIATYRNGMQAGGGEDILAELDRHGDRTPPFIGSLPRSNPLNKYLGMLLRRFAKR